MSHPTFDPARTPERDADGYFHHPDLELVLVDGTEAEEMVIDLAKLAAAGVEARFLALSDDIFAGDLCERLYLEEASAAEWKPEAQAGEQLIAICPGGFEADGPFALFVRRAEG